jgi:hypothetical protein
MLSKNAETVKNPLLVGGMRRGDGDGIGRAETIDRVIE